jgi:hypothetical protein
MNEALEKLKALLDNNCKVKKIYPQIFASDAETNLVTIEVVCEDNKTYVIRAYREEAKALREFIRLNKLLT